MSLNYDLIEMDFTTACDLGASQHEADLRHYLCFGHGPLPYGAHPFDTGNPDTEGVQRDIHQYVRNHDLTPLQIEALAWWTSFKGSRYYGGKHNWVSGLIRREG